MANTQQDITHFNFSQYLRSIKILHLALCVGVILIITILLNTLGFSSINFQDINYSFLALIVMGSISLATLGYYISNKKMESVMKSDALEVKLMAYRSNKILQLALTEGPILISCVLGFVFKEYALFLWAFLALIYMYSLAPSKNEIESKLPLTMKEKTFVNGKMTLEKWILSNEH